MKRRELLTTIGIGAAATGALALAGCERKEGAQGPAVHTGKTIQWKMVTSWPKNYPGLGTGANFLAETITALSGGRLSVKVFGAGELVPALGVFDAVSSGSAEMGHSGPYYWKGKHEATQFFTALPFGLNAAEMSSWIHHGGGQQLWDELYAQFNLKPFAAGSTGVQMGGWFNREIRTPADFKGLKIRMPGLGGDVLTKLGATTVLLPGGELFQALQSGTIDATEWVGPYNDLAFGFYKVSKYYYWPGWHEPGSVMEAMVNKTAYEALPQDLQEIVKYACRAAFNDMLSEFNSKNANALDSLVKDHKVQLKRFSDDTLKVLAKTSEEVVGEVIERDPFSKKVYESLNSFRKQALRWNTIGEEGYSLARSLGMKV